MRILIALLIASTLAASAAGLPGSLTVRIDHSRGAPRLMVNEVPRRARIFWGAPAPGRILLSPQGSQIAFEFVASSSEPASATMHLRFGQTAGEVDLDNIRVEDLTAGKDIIPETGFETPADFASNWTTWPPSPQNTVGTFGVEPGAGKDGSGGLRVRLRAPAGGLWPDFHVYHQPNLGLVQGHRYRVSFWGRAEPARDLTLAFYRPGTTYTYLGGPPGHFESQIRLAASAGVDIVSFEVPMPWPAPGETVNWEAVYAVCETVVKANPRALLLPRIAVYVPEWWKRAHPGELMQWEIGPGAALASPASQIYRRDASSRLKALIEHLESRFGDRMAGYHPCGQNTGEWFYMDSWERPLNGYGQADLAAWRQWLRGKYSTPDSLRRAWNDPSVDLETATVPPAAKRHASPAGIFRDPGSEQPIIDFVEFQQQSMAECVTGLARTVRAATRGRKLVVFFYGYVFEFGALRTGPGSSGHYALRRILDSPDIDVVCSPISYFDRGPAQSAPCMTAAESVALSKKLWLNEDDTRTFLTTESNFPGAEHEVKTLEETVGELRRNVAQEALRNFGTWWMDLPGSGWFDDAGIWAEMKRLEKLDNPLVKDPIPFHPQVAAVIDERVIPRVAEGGDAVTRPGIYEVRAALGRMGVPYGQYLQDDVERGRVNARVFVFLNAWSVDAAQRAAILRATKGAVRVWCYAPGMFDGSGLSPSGMRALTGFRIEPSRADTAWAAPTQAGIRLGLRSPFGSKQAIHPLFAAVGARPDEVLATYPDGSAAVALRKSASGIDLFVGPPGLTSELLRIAARAAGVHLLTQDDTIVYANGRYMALHGVRDGTVTVDTGTRAVVRDVFTSQSVGNGPRIGVAMKRGETRILEMEDKRKPVQNAHRRSKTGARSMTQKRH